MFKRKEKVIQPKTLSMLVNNKIYAVEDSSFIQVQSSANDIRIYGWSLEVKYNKSQTYNWYSYKNKIYNSKESAVDASLKIDSSFYDYRILPLYSMNIPQYRSYKLNKLSADVVNKKEYEIKGWKLKEDYIWYTNPHNNYTIIHKKGSIYIQLENGNIIKSGTACEHTNRIGKETLFKELIPKGLVDEIDIKEQKWLYPHLLKEIKLKLKNKEQNA